MKLAPETLAIAARELSLPIWTDSTNLESGFLRNDLRNEIFPTLLKLFPRAVPALGEFAGRWRSLQPALTPDGRWVPAAGGFEIPVEAWLLWSEHDRETQLLTLAQTLKPQCRLPGRFLESLVKSPVVTGTWGAGSGFRLSSSASVVRWERVAKVPSVQYFKQVVFGLEVRLGVVTVRISTSDSRGAIEAGVYDPQKPVWVASGGASVVRCWSRRVQPVGLGKAVFFLVQGNSVLAAINFDEKRLVWMETSSVDLNPRRLFVNLVERSEYE